MSSSATWINRANDKREGKCFTREALRWSRPGTRKMWRSWESWLALSSYKVEPGSSQRFVHGRSSKRQWMQVVAQKISTVYKEKGFTVRITRHWKRLPQKTRPWSNSSSYEVNPGLSAGLDHEISRDPFQPKLFGVWRGRSLSFPRGERLSEHLSHPILIFT